MQTKQNKKRLWILTSPLSSGSWKTLSGTSWSLSGDASICIVLEFSFRPGIVVQLDLWPMLSHGGLCMIFALPNIVTQWTIIPVGLSLEYSTTKNLHFTFWNSLISNILRCHYLLSKCDWLSVSVISISQAIYLYLENPQYIVAFSFIVLF